MNKEDILTHTVSSITLSLQAEILNKRKDFNNSKAHRQTLIHKTTTPLFKKNKQNKNVNNNKQKKKQTKYPIDLETEELLAKSQVALQKKSRLYEEMNKIENLDSVIKSSSETCLVDFEQKMIDNEFNQKFTHQFTDAPRNLIGNLGGYNSADIPGFMPAGFSNDSKLSEFNPEDSEHLHYQEAIGNEIRQHGVGYFSFSTDESTRKQEMEDLERMHKETERNIAKRQKEVRERQAKKDARMQRVRNEMRRNLTALGRDVSFLDEIEKENAIQTETDKTDNSAGATGDNVQLDKQKDEVFKLIESIRESTRQPSIREWDRDKLAVTTKKYFSEREDERKPEFAPPDIYTRKIRKK